MAVKMNPFKEFGRGAVIAAALMGGSFAMAGGGGGDDCPNSGCTINGGGDCVNMTGGFGCEDTEGCVCEWVIPSNIEREKECKCMSDGSGDDSTVAPPPPPGEG